MFENGYTGPVTSSWYMTDVTGQPDTPDTFSEEKPHMVVESVEFGSGLLSVE